MTTNARSKTSPVSTLANQSSLMRNFPFQAKPGSPERNPTDWWARPPATAGAVHVSLIGDRGGEAISTTRGRVVSSAPSRSGERGTTPAPNAAGPTLSPVHGNNVRTGAPARRESPAGQGAPLSRLVTLVGITCLVFLGGFGIANAASSPKSGERSYLVRPGDSFWSIARSVQSNGDVRPLVADLIKAHGSVSLQIGDRLELPAA